MSGGGRDGRDGTTSPAHTTGVRRAVPGNAPAMLLAGEGGQTVGRISCGQRAGRDSLERAAQLR